MAVTVLNTSVDAQRGASVEEGTFTLQPSSIVAQSQGSNTVTINGAKAGDIIYVTCQSLPAMAMLQAASVSSNNTVTLYFGNAYSATTLTFSGPLTFNYILVHLS